MAAIPDSSLPGHRQLHERVVTALDLCQESRAVEFKRSAIWETLKIKITKTALAMANLRDGGVIIVGVEEDDSTWKLTGVAASDLTTYDEDAVNDHINKFSTPTMRVELVRVAHNSMEFLAINVPEFERSPVICGRDGQDMRRGAIYVRPVGKPETKEAPNAEQIEDLLSLAAEKRARHFLETARRVGMKAPEPDAEAFDAELDGL